jgi:hypothetical protein
MFTCSSCFRFYPFIYLSLHRVFFCVCLWYVLLFSVGRPLCALASISHRSHCVCILVRALCLSLTLSLSLFLSVQVVMPLFSLEQCLSVCLRGCLSECLFLSGCLSRALLFCLSLSVSVCLFSPCVCQRVSLSCFCLLSLLLSLCVLLFQLSTS